MENLTTKEGLKIISAELKNFQSLSHKLVQIEGKSIVIVGKNGGSKSALLRAIQAPLNADTIPSKPIKQGEEQASVRIVLNGTIDGEEKEYYYNVFFNEQHQKGKITVTDSEGIEYTTRGSQKDILGNISFDVDQFIRLGMTANGKKSLAGVREQVEILRTFLTLEDRKKLNLLDTEHKNKYEARTDVNKEVTKKQALISTFDKISEKELEVYSVSKEKELTEAQTKLGNISEEMTKWDRVSRGTAEAKTKIEALKLELKELEEKATKGDEWLKVNKKPEVESLQEEIKALNDHQKAHNSVKELDATIKSLKESEKESKALTDRLKAILDEKAAIFENSTLPVKGLSFDEDGVYYKGLPLDQDHHPSSMIISVGVQLAIAMNPNLKCIFIKDGSLLDKTTFQKVLKFVESKGYQLFIEMVDWEAKDEVSVEFAETFIAE